MNYSKLKLLKTFEIFLKLLNLRQIVVKHLKLHF